MASFCVLGKDSAVGMAVAEHDLLVAALSYFTNPAGDGRQTPQTLAGLESTYADSALGMRPGTPNTLSDLKHPRPILGLVDADDLGIDYLPDSALTVNVDYLFNAYSDSRVCGLVLDAGELSEGGDILMAELLMRLYELQVPILLKCHHDSKLLETIDLKILVGIIIENACILEDGKRRDYFRSQELRDVMAKCAEQRVERPTFFVGFYDRWNTRPSAAVVRRAIKLSEHFAAVLEHGPTTPPTYHGGILKQPQSLSAFEYLRRSETSELQKAWMQGKRMVHIGNGRRDSIEKVASLPFGDLQHVVPNLDQLLMSQPLPGDLQALRFEQPMKILPPEYTNDAPERVDFWERTSTGEQIALYGCVPLLSEPTTAQHEAVLDTQIHLRNLKMLDRLDESGLNKMIEKFKQYPTNSSLSHLVEQLVDGLSRQQIVIYKGLGSGFTLPDNAAEFWGVSASHTIAHRNRESHRVRDSFPAQIDIFISRRCPNDLSTVLHTWFAHNEVPRVHRFEEELKFERIMHPDDEHHALPLSLRSQIQDATPAETLFLLEQVKMSGLTHQFRYGIEEHCRTVLMDQASAQSWNLTVARGFLSGSSDMESLLRQRLEEFIRLGANRLPSLANLLLLYRNVDKIVTDSLFMADREKLNAMTDALLHAYDPWNSWTDCDYIDINADLFAIIFFSALRKGAFEDVYTETTDRCPLFLMQPDQAAVFSELWALGSQCEAYFGMRPRDLGEIIYNRYRTFLEANPPPQGFKDKRIMTVYTKADPTSAFSEEMDHDGPSRKGFNASKAITKVRKLFLEFGALSIFCLPAILDILLLTFLGRGLFMTAWLGGDFVTAACYALLISLLISAGVTGWVGSIGNYYICNYAYDSMIYFHVQRLSGGFVITVIVGLVGLIIFVVKVNVQTGFVFLAYLIAIAMYLNVLGKFHQTSETTSHWLTICHNRRHGDYASARQPAHLGANCSVANHSCVSPVATHLRLLTWPRRPDLSSCHLRLPLPNFVPVPPALP